VQCAPVCAVCSLALMDEGGGVQLVYCRALVAGIGGQFDMRMIGVLSESFPLFLDGGWNVCECMCVYTHSEV